MFFLSQISHLISHISFVPKLFQVIFLAAPVGDNFYKHFQKYFFLKKLFHIPAGIGTYYFKHTAILTDQDIFLRIAFHNNLRADAVQFFALHKGGNNYLCAVGYLFFVLFKHLCPDHFGCKKAIVTIRQLIFIIVCRMFGQLLNHKVHYRQHVIIF